ncbi:sigma-54-dependent Fis family transcriptional regulator [Rhodothalassium salexigens]|uniref:sigma-54-dependent transcriptional regulator n=1 Tax=Rhodothalassium salexigens TaxID=1086 RepID=UPI00191277D3|nr:sigma-54 dependent transcriptional regulator [Rhodothalassium salexigens]MBK5912540.1 sigma-54-dependent Fis family transcriptional regulator [Rhodothalassium salexigens]MBK5920809.1 sigma-54-dependent Fis family transcriptional regulator [Rhodothalassium salexigens]
MTHILVVDDEPTQRLLLQAVLERAGFTVETASSGDAAIARLTGTDAGRIDCVFLDLSMPGTDGLAVIRAVRPKAPDLSIVVLTAHGGVNTAVEAMRAGASDFLVKPAAEDRIVEAAKAAGGAAAPFDAPFEPLAGEPDSDFTAIVGQSPAIRQSMRLARKAASVSLPVLIEGESGVGKELFAKAIHSVSERAQRPFIAVNCGAIPERLVESILFGHERGAFTGATDRHTGKFQEADGGTLFLDEVGELPPDIQVKLLRALQEREVEPVGARRPIKVDIRLISATNRSLEAMVADGRFREDLYYRLNVFPLTLPPLRERTGDIPSLVEDCIARVCRSENMAIKRVSADAMALMEAYHWPGNVRQLQNTIYRAVVLCEGDTLRIDDFPHLAHTAGAAVDPGNTTDRAAWPVATNPAPATDPAANGAATDVHLVRGDGHVRPLADIEADVIRCALDLYDGRMTEVARRLGIGRSTLYRKLQDLDAAGDG